MTARLRHWAAALKRHTLTVWFAARDPRTPRLVRWLALFVAAYALSPIDLIPDFIPVLGHLDDLVIVPLGLALVQRLVPEVVKQDARAQALALAGRPVGRSMAAVIVAIWILAAAAVALWALNGRT